MTRVEPLSAELLSTVEQLSQTELDRLLAEVLRIKAQHQTTPEASESQASDDRTHPDQDQQEADNSIMSFAGCWSDWSEAEYQEFMAEIAQRRQGY
jgi:hypothetical protein